MLCNKNDPVIGTEGKKWVHSCFVEFVAWYQTLGRSRQLKQTRKDSKMPCPEDESEEIWVDAWTAIKRVRLQLYCYPF